MAKPILKHARRMRKEMTPQELALWLRLRELRALGWHFRRQSLEPPYILDFVCRSAKLAIEIDGVNHASPLQSAYDQERDRELTRRGLRVLRFWASDVERELDGVIEAILNALGESNPTRRASLRTARHPPLEGEGQRSRYGSLVRLGLRTQKKY